jgi:hypothetical protein
MGFWPAEDFVVLPANWSTTESIIICWLLLQALDFAAISVGNICHRRGRRFAMFCGEATDFLRGWSRELHVLQALASFLVCLSFIGKSLSQEPTDCNDDPCKSKAIKSFYILIDKTCAFYFIFYHIWQVAEHSFAMRRIFSVVNLIDNLTVAGLLDLSLGLANSSPTWLNFGFFRAWSSAKAFERIENEHHIVFRWTRSRMMADLFVAAYDFLAFLFLFAGVMYSLEHLGNPKWMEGLFQVEEFPSDAGDTIISYFYFALVTISTVGYGDISPVTLLGQLGNIGLIVCGVIFFSVQVEKIQRAIHLEAIGEHEYRGCGHAVVVGGGLNCEDCTWLDELLSEMFHPDHHVHKDMLDVVLLSNIPLCQVAIADCCVHS